MPARLALPHASVVSTVGAARFLPGGADLPPPPVGGAVLLPTVTMRGVYLVAAKAAAAAAVSIAAAAAVAAAEPGDAVRCAVTIVGGGIGGAYTAWRLAVDARVVRPSDICVFEATKRFGGRIFSVGDVPGYEGYVVDVGAYRFHRTNHPIIRSLVEERLQMETGCYTDSTVQLPMNVTECPSSNSLWATTRTRSYIGNLTAQNAYDLGAYNEDLPYFLTDDQKWGPGMNRTQRRTVASILYGNNSLIPELATRWDALHDKTATYEATMALADEAIAALRTGAYKGIPYAEISAVQIARDAGLSPEELALDSSLGFTPFFQSNALGDLIVAAREAATARMPLPPTGPAATMVLPVVGAGAGRKRAGMVTIIEKMMNEAKAAGVRVYMGHRAVGVRRVTECDEDEYETGSAPLLVSFDNGVKVANGRLFLNMGKPDLVALGSSSEPLTSGSADFKRRVDAAFVLGGSKTYCFWPRAWWLTDLQLTAGRGRAETAAVVGPRYHDGPVQCTDPSDVETCSGGLLVSYSFGDPTGTASGFYAASFGDAPNSPRSGAEPTTVLRANSTVPRHRLALSAIVSDLRVAHKPVLDALNLTPAVIPDPDVCIVAAWYDVGLHIHRPVPRLSPASPEELFAQPAAGLPIHLVNEAWGGIHGWAESSLLSAERALGVHMRVPRPQWLDKLVYDAAITKFNKGS